MHPQEFGDGIMSAIDMFATIDPIEGKLGERRMVITLNGKVCCCCLQLLTCHCTIM
jgi:cyanate lyase